LTVCQSETLAQSSRWSRLDFSAPYTSISDGCNSNRRSQAGKPSRANGTTTSVNSDGNILYHAFDSGFCPLAPTQNPPSNFQVGFYFLKSQPKSLSGSRPRTGVRTSDPSGLPALTLATMQELAFLTAIPPREISLRLSPSYGYGNRLRCDAPHPPTRATAGTPSRRTVRAPPSSDEATGRAAGLRTVSETQPAVALTVSGTLPPWLRGTLTRVGPAVFEAEAKDGSEVSFEHWFDGLPYVHAFRIDGAAGKVSYESRHVARHVERAVASVATASKYEPLYVGTRITRPWYRKLATLFAKPTRDESTPGAECFPIGVAIERGTMGAPFMLTTDAPLSLRLDPETLVPEKFVSYAELGTPGGELSCAHGEHDPVEGAYYNLILSLAKSRAAIQIVRIDSSTGKASVFARIENCPATYVHSFSMTDEYFVIILNSARVNGLVALKERCFLEGTSFDASAPTMLHVVSRKSGRHVSSFTAPPSFFFHIANAYDSSPGEVTIDVCSYDSLGIFEGLSVHNIANGDVDPATLITYTLKDVDITGKAREADVHRRNDLVSIDLPTVHPSFKRRPYRFVYGVTVGEQSQVFGGVVKVDRRIEGADPRVLVVGRIGCYVSEPIFVPKPGGGREDDGVVLFVELDSRNAVAKSSLVVLDARTMTEVARCESSVLIPFSFHGNYFAE
jgi:carotenoid cleavage dioxygenase-like enzyme